jgi:transcriptional regulator with XRE-family HTH domain
MGNLRFSDQIRAAVDASGRSRYAICQAIGLNQGAMSRFMAGKSGISLETLDRLAQLLGLSVVVGPAPARTWHRTKTR